jgi:hypothetical protein
VTIKKKSSKKITTLIKLYIKKGVKIRKNHMKLLKTGHNKKKILKEIKKINKIYNFNPFIQNIIIQKYQHRKIIKFMNWLMGINVIMKI